MYVNIQQNKYIAKYLVCVAHSKLKEAADLWLPWTIIKSTTCIYSMTNTYISRPPHIQHD